MITRSNQALLLSPDKSALNFPSEKLQIEGVISKKKKYPSNEIKPIQQIMDESCKVCQQTHQTQTLSVGQPFFHQLSQDVKKRNEALQLPKILACLCDSQQKNKTNPKDIFRNDINFFRRQFHKQARDLAQLKKLKSLFNKWENQQVRKEKKRSNFSFSKLNLIECVLCIPKQHAEVLEKIKNGVLQKLKTKPGVPEPKLMDLYSRISSSMEFPLEDSNLEEMTEREKGFKDFKDSVNQLVKQAHQIICLSYSALINHIFEKYHSSEEYKGKLKQYKKLYKQVNVISIARPRLIELQLKNQNLLKQLRWCFPQLSDQPTEEKHSVFTSKQNPEKFSTSDYPEEQRCEKESSVQANSMKSQSNPTQKKSNFNRLKQSDYPNTPRPDLQIKHNPEIQQQNQFFINDNGEVLFKPFHSEKDYRNCSQNQQGIFISKENEQIYESGFSSQRDRKSYSQKYPININQIENFQSEDNSLFNCLNLQS